MPSSTTNYGLTLYDRTADASELFLDYRDDMAGTIAGSNMNKIDTQLKANADATASLAGAGRTTETVKTNADNILNIKTRSFYNINTSGTDTYTATSSDITAYYNGLRIKMTPSAGNTGASTININSLGAKSLTKVNDAGVASVLDAGDLRINQPVLFEYNGTVFIAITLGGGDIKLTDEIPADPIPRDADTLDGLTPLGHGLSALSALLTPIKDTFVNAINWLFDNTPKQTTADMTLYVRTDGSDSNDGSANDSAHALLTIQAAINKIPQTVNHTVTINVDAGTYAEDVVIEGFIGAGELNISGAVGEDTTHNVLSFGVYECHAGYVYIHGFNLTSIVTDNINISGSSDVRLKHLKMIESTTTYNGVFCQRGSSVTLENSTVSNRKYGVRVATNAMVNVNSTIGTSNTIGVLADTGGIVTANGISQPSGTTKQSTDKGGMIYNTDGTIGGTVRGQQVLTAARTLYVDGTLGDDTNDGLTSGAGAFKTIQAAINSLPKRLDADATINVAAGTYNELVTIKSFCGAGLLTVKGATSVITTTHSVNKFEIYGNTSPISITGFNITTTTDDSCTISNNTQLTLSYINITATGAFEGVYVSASKVYINNSEISNRRYAVYSYINSQTSVLGISGSNNTVAFRAAYGGVVAVNGTQTITGTDNFATIYGGIIVPSETNLGILQAPSGTALPATTGTIALTADGKVKTLTPTGACTLNATGGNRGDIMMLRVLTSGTTSYSITFGANMKDVGILNTGTVSAMAFTITFIHDGTYWWEISRTVAMA